jgi:enoyl-CoA hydratase/carnithine racemase
VTRATGKFWSNGLDLQWPMAHGEQVEAFSARVQAQLARVTLGVPTVAAVQGHAFGAAAMLALAHDQRLMCAERGYFCFSEVDIQIPFTDGMCDLITSKLSASAAHESMTTARRYGGSDAAAGDWSMRRCPSRNCSTRRCGGDRRWRRRPVPRWV